MGLFSYKGADTTVMVNDAADIMAYSYHGMTDALENAYNQNGYSLRTLVSAVFANDGLLDNDGSAEAAARTDIEAKGWTVMTAASLGYTGGNADADGTFQGESFKFKDAQADVLAKYDDAGNMTQIAVALRGTSGPRGDLVTDTIGDVIDYLEFFNSEPDYTFGAFHDLLEAVKNTAQAEGLDGSDVLVTGHSLGGGAVTNMAERSGDHLDGFFTDANYIGFASHYIPEDGAAVLDSGAEVLSFNFENDPVSGIIADGTVHPFGNDGEYGLSTDNIVLFNDFYDSPLYWAGDDILNLATWSAHMPFGYIGAIRQISQSAYLQEMTQDSVVVVSGLSDSRRDNTWVEDIEIAFDWTGHFGDDAFVIGTDSRDLLRGNWGNDTLEGFDGNDHLKGRNGDDRLDGGAGNDRLEGGSGNDRLIDGAGSDQLTGGWGSDVFAFVDDGVTDYITDFGNRSDRIDLSAANVTSFGDVDVSNAGFGKVRIEYGDDDIIASGFLLNPWHIDASDFIFA